MPAAKPINSRHFATWFTLFAVLAGGSQAAADPGFIAGDNDGARVALSVLNVATVPHADPVRQATDVDPRNPEPSQGLLVRLRKGFELPAIVNRRVEAELSWFLRHPDYLDRVFTRAQRYLPYIARRNRSAWPAARSRPAAHCRERLRSVCLFAWPRRRALANHSGNGEALRHSTKLVVRRPPRRHRFHPRGARLPGLSA